MPKVNSDKVFSFAPLGMQDFLQRKDLLWHLCSPKLKKISLKFLPDDFTQVDYTNVCLIVWI